VLLVKTYLAQSAIDGFGVFASEAIEEGTVIWVFNPAVDILLPMRDLADLPEIAQQFIKRYAYPHQSLQAYVLCGDDARFMNHSDRPNIRSIYPDGDIHGIDLAARPIKRGEEIVCDYFTFDSEHARRLSDLRQR
jgi:SET domain-containing protein